MLAEPTPNQSSLSPTYHYLIIDMILSLPPHFDVPHSLLVRGLFTKVTTKSVDLDGFSQ